jgi:hypothetical protein
MKFQTFIFVHDQKIILDFIKHNKFSHLSNLKYVFVGSGTTDKIETLENVVIAKNLDDNIEQYPKLTSYTGWYAIWKNNLIDSDYIHLFEYDVNVSSQLENLITKKLSFHKTEIFGYITLNVHHFNYLGHSPWSQNLVESISKNYQTNIIDLVISLPSDTNCSMTSNHTFSKDGFEKYMTWVNPLIEDIKKSPLSGHEVERSISCFYILNNISNEIIPNVLEHFQFDSHETQGIGKNKILQNYDKLLK